MAIQLFVPSFRVDECLEQIRECLEKGWTGMGFKTLEFEEAWKAYTNHPHAHFLNSNTSGLHLAVFMLKTKYNWAENDEIITTPLTFVSSNHAIRYERLKPIFADIDQSLCLSPESIETRITSRTRAILYVGLGGNTGRLDEVAAIAKKHGLKLILDAAHMAGTRLNGAHIGRQADVTVYSFQAVKNLPTADSGMICWEEQEDDLRARKLSWLGINKDTFARTSAQGNYKWMYDVEEVGFKYHGNSIMAGIGLVQLKYLDQDNDFRRCLAKQYRECLANVHGLRFVDIHPNCSSSTHLFQIMADRRDELLQFLNKNDIFPGVHYRDNSEYRMYNYAKGQCPNAETVSNSVMSLPLHLGLKPSDVDLVVSKIAEFQNSTTPTRKT